jgi:hypothetical protein
MLPVAQQTHTRLAQPIRVVRDMKRVLRGKHGAG